MFDWKSHIRETAAHLLLMANTPGWQEHARKRRDDLLADRQYAEDLRLELMRQRQAAKARS